MRGAVALAAAALAFAGGLCEAGTGLVAVVGGGKAPDAKTISLVAEAAAKEAGWTVAPSALDARNAREAAACMERDRPLPCLAPLMSPRGADRLLFLDVGPAPEEPGVLRITAIVILSENGAPSVRERFCRDCDDAKLRAAASELVRALIRAAAITAGRTVIDVRVEPAGAWIYFDGEPLPPESEAAGSRARIPTYPGAHTVTAEKEGFASALRNVTIAEGETASVPITLRALSTRAPNPADPVPGRAPSDWRTPLGWGLVGAGVAALATGGVLVALDEDQAAGPEEDHAELYLDSSSFGTKVMVAGAVSAGAGALLLLLRPKVAKRPSQSGASVSAVLGGVALTWVKAF
jgi:hypothetical protein